MQEEPHNHFCLPPLSTVTSGRHLARLIFNKPANSSERERNSNYAPKAPWNNQNHSNDNDPKETKDSQGMVPRRVKRFIPPGSPPSDGSDYGESEPNWPPKIPPKSDRWPLSNTNLTEPAAKSYHFNLNLKPETVLQWGGNTDTLAMWLNKINHCTNVATTCIESLGR